MRNDNARVRTRRERKRIFSFVNIEQIFSRFDSFFCNRIILTRSKKSVTIEVQTKTGVKIKTKWLTKRKSFFHYSTTRLS